MPEDSVAIVTGASRGIGRAREAKFQWNRSLSLDLEDDLIAKIRQKLKTGLTEDTETAKKPRNDG